MTSNATDSLASDSSARSYSFAFLIAAPQKRAKASAKRSSFWVKKEEEEEEEEEGSLLMSETTPRT